MAVTITQGTQTGIKTTTDGGNGEVQHVRVDGGTLGVLGVGTLATGTLQNLATGTINALAAGTLTGGTLQNLNFGTVSSLGTHSNAFATVVSTGTLTLGTIKAAIAGSQIFVTDLTISVGSQTTVVIGNGGTSLPIAGTFFLSELGGVVANYRTPIFTTAGSDLVFKQSAAISPMSIGVQGYVK